MKFPNEILDFFSIQCVCFSLSGCFKQFFTAWTFLLQSEDNTKKNREKARVFLATNPPKNKYSTNIPIRCFFCLFAIGSNALELRIGYKSVLKTGKFSEKEEKKTLFFVNEEHASSISITISFELHFTLQSQLNVINDAKTETKWKKIHYNSRHSIII